MDLDESLCRMPAPYYLTFPEWRWGMANIPVGWQPADIAAANMQVAVSIRGRSAIGIPVCHVMCQISPCLSLNVPQGRQREFPIDVYSVVASHLPA